MASTPGDPSARERLSEERTEVRTDGYPEPAPSPDELLPPTAVTDADTVVSERVVEGSPAAGPPPVPGEPTGGEVRAVREEERVEVGPDGAVHRRVDRVERGVTSRNPVVPALIAVLVLTLAGLAALWYFTQAEETDVPSVVGLPLDRAVGRLEEDGLTTDIVNGTSADAAPGTVFAQTPTAGTTVDEGTTVQIRVAQGPADAPVPDVVGMALADARAALEAEAFDVTVVRVDSKRPQGEVVSQTPPAGGRAEEGQAVRLEVSGGAPSVTVPNAVGLDEVSARDRIVAEGLRPRVVEVFSDEPDGQVVAQSPEAGGRLAEGGRVELRVSKGSATTTVPDTVGMPVSSAQAEVEAAGLVARVYQVPSVEPEGTVVAQNPTGGTARRGSGVRLNVSNGELPAG